MICFRSCHNISVGSRSEIDSAFPNMNFIQTQSFSCRFCEGSLLCCSSLFLLSSISRMENLTWLCKIYGHSPEFIFPSVSLLCCSATWQFQTILNVFLSWDNFYFIFLANIFYFFLHSTSVHNTFFEKTLGTSSPVMFPFKNSKYKYINEQDDYMKHEKATAESLLLWEIKVSLRPGGHRLSGSQAMSCHSRIWRRPCTTHT